MLASIPHSPVPCNLEFACLIIAKDTHTHTHTTGSVKGWDLEGHTTAGVLLLVICYSFIQVAVIVDSH